MAFRLTALLLSVAAAGLMLRRHLCLMPVISKEAVQLKAFVSGVGTSVLCSRARQMLLLGSFDF